MDSLESYFSNLMLISIGALILGVVNLLLLIGLRVDITRILRWENDRD